MHPGDCGGVAMMWRRSPSSPACDSCGRFEGTWTDPHRRRLCKECAMECLSLPE